MHWITEHILHFFGGGLAGAAVHVVGGVTGYLKDKNATKIAEGLQDASVRKASYKATGDHVGPFLITMLLFAVYLMTDFGIIPEHNDLSVHLVVWLGMAISWWFGARFVK